MIVLAFEKKKMIVEDLIMMAASPTIEYLIWSGILI